MPNEKFEELAAECDFVAISEEQMEGCVCYEYAREWKKMRSIAPKGRRWWRPNKALASALASLSTFNAEIAKCLSGTDFPAPWARLKPIDRQRFCEHFEAVTGEMLEETAILFDPRSPFAAYRDGDDWFRRFVRRIGARDRIGGSFAADLSFGRKRIVADFEKWLSEQLQNRTEPQRSTKPGPKGYSHLIIDDRKGFGIESSPRADLNRLAALRLRFYTSGFAEARRFMDELWERYPSKRTHDLDYKKAASLRRASNEAVQTFRLLFNRSEKEFPLHYRRRWKLNLGG
jgi:hypothetical protein